MGRTLLDKIWDAHTVRVEDGGRCVLYIDRQYIHEVTSPVAFAGIERRTASSTSAWDTPGRASCTSSAPSWDSPSRA